MNKRKKKGKIKKVDLRWEDPNFGTGNQVGKLEEKINEIIDYLNE